MTDLTDAVIFLSLAFGVLLVVWLVRKVLRFALRPPPIAKDLPYPIIVHLSLGERLGDLPGAKKRARPIDEDILATIRQIESQN